MVGYVSLDQLHSLADGVLEANSEPKGVSRTDWFSVSMKSVKWTGASLTCLMVIFFLVMILKAFM
jgi:hypothetical protein